MSEITEYDPSLCSTAAQFRELGYPIPKQIPDAAWVRNRDIQSRERYPDPVEGETGHTVIFETPPFRLGLTQYRVEGNKIVTDYLKETKDESRRPPGCSRPGETHPIF